MSEIPAPAAKNDLVAIARAMYPHDGLSDGPYERVIDHVLARASREPALWHRVRDGVDELASALGGAVAGASEEQIRDALVIDGHFFATLRSLVCFHLYDDHEVWEFIGYPGASFEQGGYVARGFDDLAWLPEPRIAENDAPMTEIGPLR